jgi:ferric-dicitrate binding protein FerR (iron transport regulator)
MGCEWAFPKGVGALAILLLAASSPAEVAAQDTGCLLQLAGIPPRQIIRCRGGLTVEAAAGSDYILVDHGRDGIPDSATLRGGALLVNAPERSGKRAFQIHTPQAIAAVRGTEWAVDVAGEKTAVFVVSGLVSVRRLRGPAVSLRPGEGVDVERGTAPLQVKRWSAERAASLLARFGR